MCVCCLSVCVSCVCKCVLGYLRVHMCVCLCVRACTRTNVCVCSCVTWEGVTYSATSMTRLLYSPKPLTLVMTDDSIAVSLIWYAFSYTNTHLREVQERRGSRREKKRETGWDNTMGKSFNPVFPSLPVTYRVLMNDLWVFKVKPFIGLKEILINKQEIYKIQLHKHKTLKRCLVEKTLKRP